VFPLRIEKKENKSRGLDELPSDADTTVDVQAVARAERRLFFCRLYERAELRSLFTAHAFIPLRLKPRARRRDFYAAASDRGGIDHQPSEHQSSSDNRSSQHHQIINHPTIIDPPRIIKSQNHPGQILKSSSSIPCSLLDPFPEHPRSFPTPFPGPVSSSLHTSLHHFSSP